MTHCILIKYFFDDNMIFKTFLCYKNQLKNFQKHNKATDFITSVNGSLTLTPDHSMLAISDDIDMNGYIARLENLHQNNDWCIAYFAFTLRNGKSMYTWSPDKKELKGLKYPNYEQYKDSAKVICNRTDNICYFPYNYYHVAESSNATSLVVNIAFWEENDDVDTIFEQINNSLFAGADNLSHIKLSNFSNNHFNSGMVSLTDDNVDIFHYIHNRFNEFNIKLKIIAYQLIKTTSLGLLVPRPIQKQKIDGDFLIRDDNSILQWIVLDDMLIISSNGHCSSIAYCQDIELLLNRILTNKILNIQDFQQDKSLVVIHKLYQWGCLVCATR